MEETTAKMECSCGALNHLALLIRAMKREGAKWRIRTREAGARSASAIGYGWPGPASTRHGLALPLTARAGTR